MGAGNLLITFIALQAGGAILIFPIITLFMRDKNGQRPALCGWWLIVGLLMTGIGAGLIRFIAFYVIGGKATLHPNGVLSAIFNLAIPTIVAIAVCAFLRSKKTQSAVNEQASVDDSSVQKFKADNQGKVEQPTTSIDDSCNAPAQEVIPQIPVEQTLNTMNDNSPSGLAQKDDSGLDEYYEIALDEFQNGNTSPRAYAKAIALSDGDPNKERATYVKLRAKEAADEATVRQQKIEAAERIVSENTNNIDAYNVGGYTSLMKAVEDMDVNTVASLLESGANPRILDRDFGTSTALDLAIRKQNKAETEETRHRFQKIIDILTVR